MSESGRRFCENCGTEISQTTNFCPNCGAAQRPDPEVPTGPPPLTPEPGRISTPRASDVPPPPPPQAQGSCLRTIGGVVVILVLLIVLAGLCGGGRENSKGGSTTDSDTTTQKEAQKKPVSKQKEEKAAADPNPHFGDGTHQVGTDIEPGTYRTREGSSGCYYARLSSFQGGLEEILSNDNTDAPAIVTVEPTDAGFQSRRCGTWTQDLSPITTSTTSFEDGTYFVGSDFEPGIYRSSGSSGCYHARLAGFGGGLEGIISNENTDAPSIVTIEPTDAGFLSRRCGSWTKIE